MVVLPVLPLKKQATNSDLHVTAVLGMGGEGGSLNIGRVFLTFLLNLKNKTYLCVCVWWGLVVVGVLRSSEIGKNKAFVKGPAWCFFPKLVPFALLTLAGSFCTFNCT